MTNNETNAIDAELQTILDAVFHLYTVTIQSRLHKCPIDIHQDGAVKSAKHVLEKLEPSETFADPVRMVECLTKNANIARLSVQAVGLRFEQRAWELRAVINHLAENGVDPIFKLYREVFEMEEIRNEVDHCSVTELRRVASNLAERAGRELRVAA